MIRALVAVLTVPTLLALAGTARADGVSPSAYGPPVYVPQAYGPSVTSTGYPVAHSGPYTPVTGTYTYGPGGWVPAYKTTYPLASGGYGTTSVGSPTYGYAYGATYHSATAMSSYGGDWQKIVRPRDVECTGGYTYGGYGYSGYAYTSGRWGGLYR